MSSTTACAGAVHASAAVVAFVGLSDDDVGALVAVTVDVASGDALGVTAVVPAQPAMRIERTVAAASRMPDIMQAIAVRAL